MGKRSHLKMWSGRISLCETLSAVQRLIFLWLGWSGWRCTPFQICPLWLTCRGQAISLAGMNRGPSVSQTNVGGWLFIFFSCLLAVVHSDLCRIELRYGTSILCEWMDFVNICLYRKMSWYAAVSLQVAPVNWMTQSLPQLNCYWMLTPFRFKFWYGTSSRRVSFICNKLILHSGLVLKSADLWLYLYFRPWRYSNL